MSETVAAPAVVDANPPMTFLQKFSLWLMNAGPRVQPCTLNRVAEDVYRVNTGVALDAAEQAALRDMLPAGGVLVFMVDGAAA